MGGKDNFSIIWWEVLDNWWKKDINNLENNPKIIKVVNEITKALGELNQVVDSKKENNNKKR